MKDRISKLLKAEGMTAAKLADEIGVQASGISHILSGRNNPSIDFVVKLLERFRGISPDWLLLGKGEMNRMPLSKLNVSESVISQAPENDLFSKTIENDVKDSIHKGLENDFIPENANKPNNSTSVSSQAIPDKTEVSNILKKVEKVIVLFNDGTFEYYNQT